MLRVTLAFGLSLLFPAIASAETGAAVKTVFDPVMAEVIRAQPGAVSKENAMGPMHDIGVTYTAGAPMQAKAVMQALVARLQAMGATSVQSNQTTDNHFTILFQGIPIGGKAPSSQRISGNFNQVNTVTVGAVFLPNPTAGMPMPQININQGRGRTGPGQ